MARPRGMSSILLCSFSCCTVVHGFANILHRYIFLEYAAPTQALEAVKNADGYKLDKQHTFRVNLFTDFDK